MRIQIQRTFIGSFTIKIYKFPFSNITFAPWVIILLIRRFPRCYLSSLSSFMYMYLHFFNINMKRRIHPGAIYRTRLILLNIPLLLSLLLDCVNHFDLSYRFSLWNIMLYLVFIPSIVVYEYAMCGSRNISGK